jgi:hypothetical protein
MTDLIAHGFNHGIKKNKNATVLAAKNINSPHPFPPKPLNGWANVFFRNERIFRKNGLLNHVRYKN